MTLIMGIVTMIKVTKNITTNYDIAAAKTSKGHRLMPAAPPPEVAGSNHMLLMKRMAELEEKVNALACKPPMPPEKEEMLNTALARVSALENQLNEAKKVVH